MSLLNRESILAIDDRKVEEVAVPEWGGSVLVRGMTGQERELFEDLHNQEVPGGNRAARKAGQTVIKFDRKNVRARLVAWCTVDKTGARLFSDEDFDLINAKNAGAVERIVEVAMRLSGLGEDDIDELAEEFVSGEGRGGDSSSNSVSASAKPQANSLEASPQRNLVST